MRRFPKYFLAMLLPLAVLLVRPVTPAAVLMFGQEIRLSTRPVDPRDIFRGDYVILSFSIERVDMSLLREQDRDIFSGPSTILSHNRRRHNLGPSTVHMYVTLEPDGEGIWQPAAMALEPPEAGVYLRAVASRGRISSTTVNLDYGDFLRRFYVREGTGGELEDAALRGSIIAVAKAWRGRIVLTSLEIPD